MNFFSILLLFIVAAVEFVRSDVIASIEAGDSPVGVYFPGEKDPEHDVFKHSVMEHLIEVVPAGGNVREAVKYETGLVIRSTDFSTRVRVDFGSNTNTSSVHPYTISFYNLALGDRGGDKPVELQHSGSGYIWIDGGHVITHVTDVEHPFVVRNTNKDVVFTVMLFEEHSEL